jgi:hypothetical protein
MILHSISQTENSAERDRISSTVNGSGIGPEFLVSFNINPANEIGWLCVKVLQNFLCRLPASSVSCTLFSWLAGRAHPKVDGGEDGMCSWLIGT